MLSLTIVIPVFNEEHHIKDCLDSIAAQTRAPEKVIVVDNNCTDRTVAIAKAYDFVEVIEEKRQGRGYARTAGFNAVQSDIIGRIDADSRLDSRWVEQVLKIFEEQEHIGGVTGIGRVTFLPRLNHIRTTLFSRTYYWFVHTQFRVVTMWGATCALRRNAWEHVRDDVCLDDVVVHEDQDVSLWMAAKGHTTIQSNSIVITTEGHTYRYLPKLVHYALLFASTKRLHKENGNLAKMNKLSLVPLLPGFSISVLLTPVLFAYSILLFPFDYMYKKLQ